MHCTTWVEYTLSYFRNTTSHGDGIIYISPGTDLYEAVWTNIQVLVTLSNNGLDTES